MLRFSFRTIKWRRITPFAVFTILIILLTICNGQYSGETAGYVTKFSVQKDHEVHNQKAREVAMLMKIEANPCKDFFEFACGNWSANNQPKSFGEAITPQSLMEENVNKAFQSLLNQPGKQITLAERKILNFYQSCVGVESSTPKQKEFMLNFVKQLGGIPSLPTTSWQNNYNWLGILAQLRGQFGLDILIGFEISKDMETMRDAIYLGEPKTTIIPPENCSAVAMETKDLHDEGYEALQDEISENMQRWLSMRQADAKRFGGDVISFEFQLCKKMRIEQSLPEERSEEDDQFTRNLRRNQMSNMGRNRLYGKRVAGQIPTLNQLNQIGNIDLRRYVRQILDNTPYNEEIYIRSEEYLKHLSHVVSVSEKPTIANYLMYRALSALNFPSKDNSKRRRTYCVQQVQKYFPRIAGFMYSRSNQHTDFEREVSQIFEDIKNAFDESLKSDWIDRQTGLAAHQKLNFKPRFPTYDNLVDLNQLQIEQLDYWQKLLRVMQFNARLERMNAQTETIESFDVRAKLMPINWEILVGWALLQPPLYDYYYPQSMKYAALGQRLASELAMAFDEQGWRQSPSSQQRLDAFTAEGLKNQTECFRTQYSNYLFNNPDEFRNASRLREIIASSNGLSLAFKAYMNWLKTIIPTQRDVLMRETLPHLNFSNTQLFFIHFAQLRCAAKYGEGQPPKYFPLDGHTPERYDVNGPLSNSVEFAREFGCSAGEEMNPDDKCIMY